MRVSPLLLAALCATAVPGLQAQETPAEPPPDTALALRPGMNEADVLQRWGEPIAIRRLNNWTYLFYENGMERELGFYDTVFLQGGQVVDAIVRMPGRTYLGTSSSPEGRLPEFTPPNRTPTPGAAVVGGATVTPAPRPER